MTGRFRRLFARRRAVRGGGPPVARRTAGVLLAERFEVVVTDPGAGPELARVAVGGVLNPADG
jgi:hypothetical protein